MELHRNTQGEILNVIMISVSSSNNAIQYNALTHLLKLVVS